MSDAGPALLVVDDLEDNRAVLIARLRRLGYTDVTEAENGKKALDLMGGRSYDLVLLDVMMPEMNGYQVLERLREEGRLTHLPVIVVSALAEMDSVIRCIELGAEDYLTKPLNAVLLKARVGACLEKKRLRDEVTRHLERMERELASAREIQLGMVPSVFPTPGPERPVEVFATLEPARQVGGDLYDVFMLGSGHLGFVVADVSDKGAPAALFMARTKTLMRLMATLAPPASGVPDPAEILARVNVELCLDNEQGMFVTLFFGLLEPATGALTFCNAGHGVPYVTAADGRVSPLGGARCKPLGIRPTFPYETSSFALAPGDGLFVFTDGITEAMDAAGQLFSEERLEAALAEHAAAAPRALVDAVLARVREFEAGAPPSDDIAALAVRRLPLP
jgi:sigma-B regulation protein RsbU (phosphoserine phosphatase)